MQVLCTPQCLPDVRAVCCLVPWPPAHRTQTAEDPLFSALTHDPLLWMVHLQQWPAAAKRLWFCGIA